MLAGTPTASTNQSTNQSYRFLRYEGFGVFTWRQRRRGGRCGEAGRRCGGARSIVTVKEKTQPISRKVRRLGW